MTDEAKKVVEAFEHYCSNAVDEKGSPATSQVNPRPAMKVMEQQTEQPPEQTPSEREVEERWVEEQYRKHCPWRIRLAKWVIRKIARKP